MSLLSRRERGVMSGGGFALPSQGWGIGVVRPLSIFLRGVSLLAGICGSLRRGVFSTTHLSTSHATTHNTSCIELDRLAGDEWQSHPPLLIRAFVQVVLVESSSV